MAKLNDGGPAYPLPQGEHQQGDQPVLGMSLLDYHAGQIANGWFSNPYRADPERYPNIAQSCYKMAQALVDEKNRLVAEAEAESRA